MSLLLPAASLIALGAFFIHADRTGVTPLFIWTWLLALFLSILNALPRWSTRVRAVSLAIAGLSVAMLVAELAFRAERVPTLLEATPAMTVLRGNAYFRDDASLGFAAMPNSKVRSRKRFGGKTLYDVVYTIDANGHRQTRGDPEGDTWLFAGCSFTFGEGLEDNETLPSYFSGLLGYHANVVNAAFHGYGAHQMLRLLETNRIEGIHPTVRQVFFEVIDSHVRRAAGRASWDLAGPKYKLDGDSVKYVGNFHSVRTITLLHIAEKSDLLKYFLFRLYFDESFNRDELEVYARILERSARIVRQAYGAGFAILLWDDDTEPGHQMLARLEKTGIPVMKVSEIIPRAEWAGYKLPVDGHPAPQANRAFAAALARRFVSPDSSTPKKSRQLVILDSAKSRIQPSGAIPASR
jgi:hypothetical protein